MTDPIDDDAITSRIQALLEHAVDHLDPVDRAERIAHCRRTGEHGVVMHVDDNDDMLSFVWGGRALMVVQRQVLLEDAAFTATFIAEPGDTVPTEWTDDR